MSKHWGLPLPLRCVAHQTRECPICMSSKFKPSETLPVVLGSPADQIRALRAAQPVRTCDGGNDPLRNFLSEVVLRDHARLLKLTLRKLHEGEPVRDGDFYTVSDGTLSRLDLPWWRRRRVVAGETIHRCAT